MATRSARQRASLLWPASTGHFHFSMGAAGRSRCCPVNTSSMERTTARGGQSQPPCWYRVPTLSAGQRSHLQPRCKINIDALRWPRARSSRSVSHTAGDARRRRWSPGQRQRGSECGSRGRLCADQEAPAECEQQQPQPSCRSSRTPTAYTSRAAALPVFASCCQGRPQHSDFPGSGSRAHQRADGAGNLAGNRAHL